MPASHPQRTHTDRFATDLRLTSGHPSPAFQPLAVTEAEAGRLLSISSRTLYSLRKRGILKAIKISGGKKAHILYSMDELRRFVASSN